MAGKKISELLSGAPAQASDEFPVRREADNYRLTLQDIASAAIFSQPESAAVLRSLLAKGRDFINVKDYGAVGDGETDDTDAILEAIQVLNGRSPLFDGYRTGQAELFFPEGVYRITQSGVLSNIGVTKRRGYKVTGAGLHSSLLWLDTTDAEADMWFYDNGGTQRVWGAAFEDIGFVSGDEWYEVDPATDVGDGYDAINPFGNGFKISGPGWESGFTFTRCLFRHLEQVAEYAGSNNADSHRFFGCEVLKCTNVNYMNNPQAFSVNWIGCYINQIFGDFLRYGSNANGGGGNFAMIGGAIIADASGRDVDSFIVHAVDGGPSNANAPVTFTDVRFELKGNYTRFASASFAATEIVVSKSSFWNTASSNKVHTFVSRSCSVIFTDGTSFSHGLNGGKFTFEIGSSGRLGKNALLAFTNCCVVLSDIHSTPLVSWTGSGNDEGRLLIDETCTSAEFTDPSSGSVVTALACDINGAGTATSSTRSRTQKRFVLNMRQSNVALSGALGLTGQSVQLPPYSRIVEAGIRIRSGTGTGSTVRYFIGTDDKTTEIFVQTPSGAQNGGGHFVVEYPYSVGGSSARTIRLWVDDGSGSASAAGTSAGELDAWIVYDGLS